MRHSHSSPSLSRRSSSHECKPLHSCSYYNIHHLSSAPFLLIFAKKEAVRAKRLPLVDHELLFLSAICRSCRCAGCEHQGEHRVRHVHRRRVCRLLSICAVVDLDQLIYRCLQILTMSSTSSCVISGSLVRFSARASSWMRACALSVV